MVATRRMRYTCLRCFVFVFISLRDGLTRMRTLFDNVRALINTAGSPFTGSALLQIPANGFELNKLVIGKPGGPSDANKGDGFIDPATLGTCVDQAKAKGWNAGVMAFQFPDADAAWVKSAKGTSFQ